MAAFFYIRSTLDDLLHTMSLTSAVVLNDSNSSLYFQLGLLLNLDCIFFITYVIHFINITKINADSLCLKMNLCHPFPHKTPGPLPVFPILGNEGIICLPEI